METYSKVTIDFVAPDGTTYPSKDVPKDAQCHVCSRLIVEHTGEELHECAKKQQNVPMR